MLFILKRFIFISFYLKSCIHLYIHYIRIFENIRHSYIRGNQISRKKFKKSKWAFHDNRQIINILDLKIRHLLTERMCLYFFLHALRMTSFINSFLLVLKRFLLLCHGQLNYGWVTICNKSAKKSNAIKAFHSFVTRFKYLLSINFNILRVI